LLQIGPDRDEQGCWRVRWPQGGVDVPLAGATGEWLVENAALLVTRADGWMVIYDNQRRDCVRTVARLLAGEFGVARSARLIARCGRLARSDRPRRAHGRQRKSGRRSR